MTLAASGTLWLASTTDGTDRSIMYEVEGVSSPPYNFLLAVSNSTPSVGSAPINFSDFYGHEQTTLYGRMYGTNSTGTGYYISSNAYGHYSLADGDNVTYKYTGSGGETGDTTWVAQGPAGQPFDGTEGYTASIYRRTKQTSGGWGTALQTWNNYASETYTSTDYTNYDYLWTLV